MTEFIQKVEVSKWQRIVMLYDSGQQGKIQPEFFDPDYWKSRTGTEILAKGRGYTYKVQSSETEPAWVLRQYFRGGLFGRFIKQSYLFTGENKVRSFQEFRITQSLYAQGLPVPEPVAAVYYRTGATYKAAILTRYLPDTVTLSHMLQKSGEIQWSFIAEAIYKLHAAGLVHSDLNAHNVLIHPDQTVTIIDLDKSGYFPIVQKTVGASFPVMMLSGAHRDNLKRFKRSLEKVSTHSQEQKEKDWEKFIIAYRSLSN